MKENVRDLWLTLKKIRNSKVWNFWSTREEIKGNRKIEQRRNK